MVSMREAEKNIHIMGGIHPYIVKFKDIKCSFKVDIGELAKDYGLCINGYNKL